VNDKRAASGSGGETSLRMPAPVIEWSGVTVSLGCHPVVHDATFTIEARDSVAFFGCSGSGKSTVLKTCVGLVMPTAGTVRLFGHDLSAISHRELLALRRDRLGFVFQKGALLSNLRVRDNLALPLRYHTDYPEDRIRVAVDERMQAVGAQEYADLFPAQLSYTAQKQVGVARALMMAPDLLMFDDPTAFLDDAAERAIIELLQRLRETPTTIVIATDSMSVVRAIARRIFVLERGTVTECATPEEAQRCVRSRFCAYTAS